MGKQDARSLPGEAQEDLRRRVVEAVQKGLSQTEAARVFGIARGTVSRWMGLVEREGRRALKARRRGRPAVARLAPHQAAYDGASHCQWLSRPAELALCVVDQRSGARVTVAKIRSAGFGVDGGTLFARLGSDPAEAGAPRV